MKITISNAWVPPLTRHNSAVLMNAFFAAKVNSSSFTNHKKDQLNSVRIWLCVLTLADITYPTGKHIEAWAQTGSCRLASSIHWPHQVRPSEGFLRTWWSLLCSAFNPSLPQSLRIWELLPLITPLGQWRVFPTCGRFLIFITIVEVI